MRCAFSGSYANGLRPIGRCRRTALVFSKSVARRCSPCRCKRPRVRRAYRPDRGKHLRVSPWIIGADIPEMPLEVTTSEAPTTVIFILDLQDYFGAGSLRPLINQIGVRDDQISALRLSAVDLVRLLH